MCSVWKWVVARYHRHESTTSRLAPAGGTPPRKYSCPHGWSRGKGSHCCCSTRVGRCMYCPSCRRRQPACDSVRPLPTLHNCRLGLGRMWSTPKIIYNSPLKIPMSKWKAASTLNMFNKYFIRSNPTCISHFTYSSFLPLEKQMQLFYFSGVSCCFLL